MLTARSLAYCDIPVSHCETCDGIWIDRMEMTKLEALRDGEAGRRATLREPTLANRLQQFLHGMPIEFNVRLRRTPVATWSIIAVCALAFVAQALLGQGQPFPGGAATGQLGLVAAAWPSQAWWTALLGHAFLHADMFHLLGNMYFLHLLGDNVEDVFGRRRFLAFYLFCAACAGAIQTAVDPSSNVPMVGASGAIAGVAAAYTMLFRRAGLTMMVVYVQYKVAPAVYWGIWVVFNMIGALVGVKGVGWFAHLGGFAAGLAIAWLAYARVLAANPALAYLNSPEYSARAAGRRPWRLRPMARRNARKAHEALTGRLPR